MAIKAYAVDMC